MSKDFWYELAGQPEALDQIRRAVENRAEGVFHSWLITGPPGSGRSVLAEKFAAALQCPEMGCGKCHSCVLAEAGTNPDINVLSTEKVQIAIAEVRDLVNQSSFGSSMGGYRVLIIEDADTISEISTFIEAKGTYMADDGYHDDLVMSLVLFSWLTTNPYFKDLNNINLREIMYKKQMQAIEDELTPFGVYDDGNAEEKAPLNF